MPLCTSCVNWHSFLEYIKQFNWKGPTKFIKSYSLTTQELKLVFRSSIVALLSILDSFFAKEHQLPLGIDDIRGLKFFLLSSCLNGDCGKEASMWVYLSGYMTVLQSQKTWRWRA